MFNTHLSKKLTTFLGIYELLSLLVAACTRKVIGGEFVPCLVAGGFAILSRWTCRAFRSEMAERRRTSGVATLDVPANRRRLRPYSNSIMISVSHSVLIMRIRKTTRLKNGTSDKSCCCDGQVTCIPSIFFRRYLIHRYSLVKARKNVFFCLLRVVYMSDLL